MVINDWWIGCESWKPIGQLDIKESIIVSDIIDVIIIIIVVVVVVVVVFIILVIVFFIYLFIYFLCVCKEKFMLIYCYD